MIRLNLCDYSNVYILISGTITINGAGGDDAVKRTDERNKGVIIKNCAVFTNCISEINNTQIDNGKHIDFAMPIYDLIEYIDYCSKTSENLWKYHRDKPSSTILNSESFKSKIRTTGGKKTLLLVV